VLPVAIGHRHDIRADRHEFPAGLLPALSARRANRKHDLVAGSTVVARPAEQLPRHQQQRGIIV
jgi:hypothetical protein